MEKLKLWRFAVEYREKEKVSEGIKAVWWIKKDCKLFKLSDRVLIQGNTVEIVYIFQSSLNVNENSVSMNVKYPILLTDILVMSENGLN